MAPVGNAYYIPSQDRFLVLQEALTFRTEWLHCYGYCGCWSVLTHSLMQAS